MSIGKAVWKDVEAIRDQAPLVHNITNYVVTNTTANALLAIGASPAMTHFTREMYELVPISGALVINMGTLTGEYVDCIPVGWQVAKENHVPVILDPVAVGALPSRTELARDWLSRFPAAAIRGNASEIMALADMGQGGKGVDSMHGSNDALDAARHLANDNGCIVCVSGEQDLVTDGKTTHAVANGHVMMTRVTGLGCTATALIGAFAAVNKDYLLAVTHAMAIMGLAGELAEAESKGPGSLQMNFYDALYNLDEEQVAKGVRVELG